MVVTTHRESSGNGSFWQPVPLKEWALRDPRPARTADEQDVDEQGVDEQGASAWEPAALLSDAAVLQRIRQAERQARRAHWQLLEALGESHTRGLAGQAGFRDTAQMLSAMLDLTPGLARGRVAEADQLAPRRSLTGQNLPPQLPATSQALSAGQIGAPQAQTITTIMGHVQQVADLEQQQAAEGQLARQASHLNTTALGRLGRRILAHLDPDGPEPDSQIAASPNGELRLRERRDGGLGLDGRLGPEHGPALRELIDHLAAPRPAGPDTPDPRGLEQRQADALVEVCELARAAERAPQAGGEPPHLAVTIPLEQLVTEIGAGVLNNGHWLRAEDARRWACDAKIIPVVLGGHSEPLDVGRAARTAPAGIRRAVIARDRHCVFPGCNKPPGRCHTHHIQHWADGGETALDNLCLLCDHHHRYIHHTGWDVEIAAGRVWLRPPAIIDPARVARTNPLRE